MIIISWSHPTCITRRTNPLQRSGDYILLFCQAPKWNSSVPSSVFGIFPIAHCIGFFLIVIVEKIIDQTVMRRIQSRNQTPVIRESDAWITWNHRSGLDTFVRIFQKIFGVVFFGIIISETVRRNHDHVRFCHRFRIIQTIRNYDLCGVCDCRLSIDDD